jgi:hypothetical protein
MRLAVLCVAAWTAEFSCAWALPPAATPQKSYDYTLAYGLVFLGLMLGLLCVLRRSGRRTEAGPQQYVSKSILIKEE